MKFLEDKRKVRRRCYRALESLGILIKKYPDNIEQNQRIKKLVIRILSKTK